MAAEPGQSSVRDDLQLNQLEKQARWQRAQLRDDISDLKLGLRQTFDAKHITRRYFWPLVGVATLVALVAGYSFVGIFSGHGE